MVREIRVVYSLRSTLVDHCRLTACFRLRRYMQTMNWMRHNNRNCNRNRTAVERRLDSTVVAAPFVECIAHSNAVEAFRLNRWIGFERFYKSIRKYFVNHKSLIIAKLNMTLTSNCIDCYLPWMHGCQRGRSSSIAVSGSWSDHIRLCTFVPIENAFSVFFKGKIVKKILKK